MAYSLPLLFPANHISSARLLKSPSAPKFSDRLIVIDRVGKIVFAVNKACLITATLEGIPVQCWSDEIKMVFQESQSKRWLLARERNPEDPACTESLVNIQGCAAAPCSHTIGHLLVRSPSLSVIDCETTGL